MSEDPRAMSKAAQAARERRRYMLGGQPTQIRHVILHMTNGMTIGFANCSAETAGRLKGSVGQHRVFRFVSGADEAYFNGNQIVLMLESMTNSVDPPHEVNLLLRNQ